MFWSHLNFIVWHKHTHTYTEPRLTLSLSRSPKYIYTTHCILCIERLSRTCLTAATSLIESHIHMTTVQCVVPTLASPKHSYVGHKTKQIFISTRTIHFMKQFIFHMRWILLLSLSITLDRVGCFVLMYALLSLFRFVVAVSFIQHFFLVRSCVFIWNIHRGQNHSAYSPFMFTALKYFVNIVCVCVIEALASLNWNYFVFDFFYSFCVSVFPSNGKFVSFFFHFS